MNDDAILLTEADRCFRCGDLRGAYDRARTVLRRNRGSAHAHWLIARIATEQGSCADAVRLCEIAVTLDPEDAAYRAQLAYALVLTGQVVAARTAAAAALALPDASAETLDLIGAVFHAVCDFTSGAIALRRAVTIAPDSPALLANLGAMLTICGDLPAARDAFRRAIEAAPAMARPYGALSEIRAATPDDNNVAALQSLLQSTDDPRDRIVLSHALAREQEALGAHDRAFATLAAGKSAMAAALAPDPSVDAAMFDALTRMLARDDARAGHADPSPIFVVGMPRSGTTVVERILTNGDGVESIGESREFARLVAVATGTTTRRFVDAAALEERWGTLDLAAIGRAYVDHAAALLPEAIRTVDKMPLNLLLADLIVRALPNARIICTIRDPRDIVVGNYRQLFEFDTGTYDYTLSLAQAARYVAHATAWARLIEQRHPDNVHIVDLEHLIADPAGESRRITEACRLPWQPDCVAIERNRNPIGTASAIQARDRIHAGHVGRWRRYASQMDEASQILRLAGVLPAERPSKPPINRRKIRSRSSS